MNLVSRHDPLYMIHIVQERPVVLWLEGQMQSLVELLGGDHLNHVAPFAEQICQSSMKILKLLRNLVARYLIAVLDTAVDCLPSVLAQHKQTVVNGFEDQFAEFARIKRGSSTR